MTAEHLTTEPQTSPVATTRWLRGKPHGPNGGCICCPGETAHVFGYTGQIEGLAMDWSRFVYDAVRQMPEGTRFTVTVTPITD